MEVFENQEFGSIRVLQEAGKTFFCASDVAKALGYVNPYAAVKRHCRGPLTKREGVVQKVNQYGDAGEQVVEISFITEGDVYRLIVHSKLPSAERFEHWVFDEVLPSIRKHGVYMSDSILDQVIQHPEVIYTLAQELVAEREQLEGIRKQLDAAQPKADYFDTFVNSEGNRNPGEDGSSSLTGSPLSVPQSKRLADAFCRQICKGLFYCPGLLRQKRKTGAADESDLQGKESSLQVV